MLPAAPSAASWLCALVHEGGRPLATLYWVARPSRMVAGRCRCHAGDLQVRRRQAAVPPLVYQQQWVLQVTKYAWGTERILQKVLLQHLQRCRQYSLYVLLV